ncbi:MAG TPA: hypothetical protein VH165_00705 [Kofleriaceae bacterium]|jgi:hypothetical protein|nr:hypothetical protein [Kofleriaceae bacterium]
MKKLKLQRETLRVLNHLDLGQIHGGAVTTSIILKPTFACPIQTVNGCTGGACFETTTIGGGTSVINPSGG